MAHKLMEKVLKLFRQRGTISSSRVILALFGGLIVVGTLLLMLPFSYAGEQHVRFIDALFTSTSAVCVTGLVVHDSATAWTPFGQFVILALIELGGLGFVTSVLFFRVLADRGRSIIRRSILRDAVSVPQIGGINQLLSFILSVSLAAELIGAALVAPAFVRDYGLMGIWYAVFHSVSAFCNAGFDILGGHVEFSSLIAYQTDPVVILVTAGLIIFGGIGFLTWDDVRKHGRHIRRYRLQTKLVLAGTFFLLLIPFLLFFYYEFRGIGLKRRLLLSFFCAVTPRTAGFASVDYGVMSESGRLLTGMLMLIGGSSGSTAGGIKVTTLMVVLMATRAVLKQERDTTAFGRRVEPELVRKAFVFFVIYVSLWAIGSLFICVYEEVPALNAMFECASALATVGLSTGITPSLRMRSKLLLIAFMFFGRIGGLTMAYAFSQPASVSAAKYPTERLAVG